MLVHLWFEDGVLTLNGFFFSFFLLLFHSFSRQLRKWASKNLVSSCSFFFPTTDIQSNLNWPPNIRIEFFLKSCLRILRIKNYEQISKNKLEMSLYTLHVCLLCIPACNKLYRYILSYKSGAFQKLRRKEFTCVWEERRQR